MTLSHITCLVLLTAITSTSGPALAEGKLADRPPAKAQPARKETEKTIAIRKLLVVTGADQLGIQVLQQTIGLLKTSMPKVPEKFWQEFMEEVNPDELLDLIVPLYDKYLSLQEVKDIVSFYETPSGKKLVSAMPMITQESMEAGKQWGEAIGARVSRRLQDKGIRSQ